MSHKELIYIVASPDMAQVQAIYRDDVHIFKPPFPFIHNGWYVRCLKAMRQDYLLPVSVHRYIGILRAYSDHPESGGIIDSLYASAVPPELESFFDSLLLVL